MLIKYGSRAVLFIVVCVFLFSLADCSSQKAGPLELGIRNFDAGEYDMAKTNFEAALAAGADSSDAYYYLGRLDINAGNIDGAVDNLEKAIKLNDAASDYHLYLAIAYAQKIQKASMFEKGQLAPRLKSEFERAVELNPSNVQARMGLAQYYLSAPPFAGGSTEKAKEQIEEIKKLDPKQGHFFMAQIHMAKKEYDEAEGELRAALALNEKDPEVHYQLGMLHQTRERYAAAFESLEKAIQSDPDYMGAYYQIARTAIFAGDNFERGIECLRLYLAKDEQPGQPSWAHAHWRLGMLYEKAGNTDMAKKEYQAALDLNSSITEAKEALERLSN